MNTAKSVLMLSLLASGALFGSPSVNAADIPVTPQDEPIRPPGPRFPDSKASITGRVSKNAQRAKRKGKKK